MSNIKSRRISKEGFFYLFYSNTPFEYKKTREVYIKDVSVFIKTQNCHEYNIVLTCAEWPDEKIITAKDIIVYGRRYV